MKKNMIIFGVMLFAMVFMSSCYKDIISPEIEQIPQPVSFKTDIAPLVKANCTEVGCHVVGGKIPYMDDVSLTFKNVVSAGYVNTTFPKNSKFYQYVYGEMAQYTTKEERTKIYDWIRTGAKNN